MEIVKLKSAEYGESNKGTQSFGNSQGCLQKLICG